MANPLLANIITDASDWLGDFSANWWFLIIIFVVAFLDSIVPIVPSETMVIIGGVAAGSGDQNLLAVIAAGAIGAFLGDNTAYIVGDTMSGRIERMAEKRPKWKDRLRWADRQIHLRGGLLLITARFIPGGRTALTVSCGITHQNRRWFMGWIAIATTIWATYAALLGYFGGKAFEDDHTKAFLTAFLTAMGATVLIEVVRHFVSRRSSGRGAATAVEVATAVVAPPDASSPDAHLDASPDASSTDAHLDASPDASSPDAHLDDASPDRSPLADEPTDGTIGAESSNER